LLFNVPRLTINKTMKGYQYRSLIISIAASLFIAMPFSSCKKYEEGPYFSIHSKKERVANTWKVERAYKNGEDKTSDYSDFRITFTKDEKYTLISNEGGISLNISGTWSFINNKEDIQTTSDNEFLGARLVDVYKIVKLKEKEMWVKHEDTEFHLIPG
jgi:hypothetical protein